MPPVKNAVKRYLIIDRVISNKYKKYPSIEDIHAAVEEELETPISISSIEKDMKAMRLDVDLKYFAPIKYSRKNGGYYYEDPEYTIQGIVLNDDDKLSLRYVAAILKQFKKDSLVSFFEETMLKINDQLDIEIEPLQKIQFEYQPYVKGRELIPEILEAIENRIILEFSYQSGHAPEKGSKKRTVIPYLLKEYRNRWYMVSYHLDKKDIRTWALDRIEALKLTKRFNDYLPEFNHDDYFKYSFGITVTNESKPKEIKLSFDPSEKHYLLAQPLHHSQKILSDTDREFIISIYCYPCTELDRTIKSYGNLVKIVE